MPLNFNLEVELFVRLDDATRTYAFSGRPFELDGFSMSQESFRGVYRRKEWGKHLAWDGMVPVKFDTGAVFDRIDAALVLALAAPLSLGGCSGTPRGNRGRGRFGALFATRQPRW